MNTLKSKVIFQLNSCLSKFKALNWNTLDLPESFQDIEEDLIPFNIEKITQVIEINTSVRCVKNDLKEKQLECKITYEAFLNMKKEEQKVDKSINGVTYDVVSYDKNKKLHRVEWKNPYKITEDEIKGLPNSFWFQTRADYKGAVLRILPMSISLLSMIENTWGYIIDKSLKDEINELILIARDYRSEHESVEMTEDDITTEFMMKIMSESGCLDENLNYNKDYKNISDQQKETVIKTILKNVKPMFDFAKKNAEDPINIGRWIPSNVNGTSSFNRDDDPVNHTRLPKVISTLPDRDYIRIEEWEERGMDICKFFDTFTITTKNGEEKEVIYEKGAQKTLLSVIQHLDKVEKHKEALREYNLIYALNSSLKRQEHEGIQEALEDFRLQTNLDNESAEELISLLTNPKAGQETRTEILHSYLKGIGEILTQDTEGGIKVDSAGEMLLNEATSKMADKRKNKTVDQRVKPPAMIKDYEKEIDDQLQTQVHDDGVDSNWNLIFNDAYNEKSLKRISNLLSNAAISRLDQIGESRYYGVIFQQFMFLKQILADGNVGKAQSTNGFRIIYHKDRGFYTLKTNDTSKITSGTMWNFGCFTKRDGDDNQFPLIYGDHYYIETETKVYFVSKPYTMSLQILQRPFFQLSAWIATMLTMTEEMNAEMREEFLNSNLLLHSLFWDYNANIRHSLTAINFLYKLPLASGFFGRYEMKGRLDKYIVKDSRMATIYYRIKNNWDTFVNQIREKKAELIKKGGKVTVSKILNGIKDPIFGFKHRSALTLNNVGFLKNILLKNDGVDEEKFLATQYKTEREHYTVDYLQSEVVKMWDKFKDGLSHFKDFDDQFKKFTECLFSVDKSGNPTWAPVSFYPEIVDIMANDLYSEIEEKNPKIKNDIRRWVTENAISSEKQSKVNLFDSAKTEELMQDYLKKFKLREADMKDEKFIEYCATKGFLVGIRSFDLPTAMKLEIKRMADYLKSISSPERPFYMFNKGPKLLHLAMFGLLKYGNSCVVTQHMKEQVGDLRIFFMQELSMRNGNRVIDKVHSALLSKVLEDLIMKKGDRKLMSIEKMNELIQSLDILPMIISCDQKRYGDTYPLATLFIKINLLFEKDWITRDEYMIFKKCLLLIQNRYVVLNPKVRAFLHKIDVKEIDPLVSLSKQSREIAADLKVIFDDKMKAEDFVSYKDQDLIQLISKNKGLKKGVGWILGVMNMFSSVDTTLHLKTVIECVKHLLLGLPVITGGTHSDDEIIITALRSISVNTFTESDGTKNQLIEDLPSIIEKGEKFTIDKNGIFSTTSLRNYRIEDLSGLILTLSLYTPRFFGQRPSLAKWVWGDSGEVLQTTVQNGSSTQPISKWLTVFARELPYVSPGADLQHMIAQVIPSLKHGASEELIACGFILVNKVLSWIYPDLERSITLPPELGGYWWAIPALIKESGFAANEIRLYTLSDYSRRIIKIMSKTSRLWNFSKINQESKEYEVHSRVDLQLVFSVYTSTDKNIQELIKRLNLEEKLSEMGFDNFYSNLKAFASEGKATRLKQGKTVENNTVTYLTRMYSPSFQRRMFTVKPSKAIIATLGYVNRKFKNIFKEEYWDRPLITYSDWKKIILTEAINEVDQDKAINLFEKVYQEDIIYHNRFMVTEDFLVKYYKEPQIGRIFDMKYKEVTTSREGYYPDFGKAVILTCYDLMSELIPQGELLDNIRKTETYMYNQEICEEDGFETAVRTWMENFKRLRLKREDLIEVYDFLVGVLSSTYALDIIKRVEKDSHIFVDSFKNMWSSNQYLEFKVDKFTAIMLENEEQSKYLNVKDLLASSNAKDLVSESKDADRILAINGWIKEIYGLKADQVKIKVGNTLEISERVLTEKYRDLEIKDLGEGYYERNVKTNKFKNKVLLRELSLYSQNKLSEGHSIKFYRGIAHRIKEEKKSKKYKNFILENKYTIFALEYDNRFRVQLVYENYREDLDQNKEMKIWLFFENMREPNGLILQTDMYKLGPLLEFLNYFLITSMQAKVEVNSPKLLFNPDWNIAGKGLKVYKWDEGYELQQNSDLKHINVHLGTLVPTEYLQKGEMNQNGILFRPLKNLIKIQNNNLDWESTSRPLMANYLITPWIKNDSELNFSIVLRENEEEIYKDTSISTRFGEPNQELRDYLVQKYWFLFRVNEMPTDIMVNMISIVDSYICNVDTLAEIRENSQTNKKFICSFGVKEWSSFIMRITKLATEYLSKDHTDSNSYKVYLEGVRIMNTYRVQLGELAVPEDQEMKNLVLEDRKLLVNHLEENAIKLAIGSDIMLIAQYSIAKGLNDDFFLNKGSYYKKPTPKLGLLRPKVSLMDTRTYLKFLYEPIIGEPEDVTEQHITVFQMLNTRGNLPINLLSDILTGTKANNKSILLLKLVSSGRGTTWCRTKMRISSIILNIINDMRDEKEGINKIIGLIEVLEY